MARGYAGEGNNVTIHVLVILLVSFKLLKLFIENAVHNDTFGLPIHMNTDFSG